MKKYYLLFPALLLFLTSHTQENLPADYLTKQFHAARREALRELMPPGSVAVIFSYAIRNFSHDIDYPYHPNPDLYYFSGYMEPNALLLIFKEPQKAPEGGFYKELFFVQRRDPDMETWTGHRLGVEGVKTDLGFDSVYTGGEFQDYPIDLSSFSHIIFQQLPDDIHEDSADKGSLYSLTEAFRKKAALPASFNFPADELIRALAKWARPANLSQLKSILQERMKQDARLRDDEDANVFLAVKDSDDLVSLRQKLDDVKWNTYLFAQLTATLREIKTPEEMTLMRKVIRISCLGHNEAMKAIHPGISERELQGIQEFVHKKLGAEYVGYPSIVGAGANGCTLHYETNNRINIGKDMVLMDIGAEYHGYSADVTRTVPSTGHFTREQKAIYNLVYKTQEAIFPLCHEGILFDSLNKKAREVLGEGLIRLGIIKDMQALDQYYPHGCSHYLGLDVHDKGDYGPLKENMVITVEPGIYIMKGSPCDPKWWNIGVRIEDDVRIGKNHFELLSRFAPRRWDAVEKMVAKKSILDQFQIPDR